MFDGPDRPAGHGDPLRTRFTMSLVPPGRAGRREAASSVAPVWHCTARDCGDHGRGGLVDVPQELLGGETAAKLLNGARFGLARPVDRKSTRLNSSHNTISYA